MPMNMFVRPALSRRSVLAGAAIAVAFPALPASAAKAVTKESVAKAFLDSIYQRYVGNSVETAKGIPLASAKSVRGYFTVGLASLIIDDQATAAKRGEAPVLDGDPFVGRQDWDISNLAIEVKETGALKAIGTVTFMNSGKPEKVVLELLRSGDDWRIADITWESGSLRGLYRRKATRDAETAPR
jgi:hypothetical protein